MDKVRAFIDETADFYHCKSWDDAILESYKMTGFDWMREKEFDWDIVDVHSQELEMRSALEFLRPELNARQLEILGHWDASYREWRDQDVFFERYEAAHGARFTWERARESAEKTLGRKIPPSHWWFWPPHEKPKQK